MPLDRCGATWLTWHVPEEWETKRVAWMREQGVSHWRDASGRELTLVPRPAASEAPSAAPALPAALGPSAKRGPR